jgi:hypothetical protein
MLYRVNCRVLSPFWALVDTETMTWVSDPPGKDVFAIVRSLYGREVEGTSGGLFNVFPGGKVTLS